MNKKLKKRLIKLFLITSGIFLIVMLTCLYMIWPYIRRPAKRTGRSSGPTKSSINRSKTAKKTLTPEQKLKQVISEYTCRFYFYYEEYEDDMEEEAGTDNGSAFSNKPFPDAPKVKMVRALTVPIPESIMTVAGVSSDDGYTTRVNSADSLPDTLNKEEVTALLYFIHKLHKEDHKLSLVEYNAVKNQAIMAIMKQRIFPEKLTNHLIGIFYDPELDDIIHDYAIQFLGQWYPQMQKEEQQIVNLVFEEAVNRRDEISGTALIALSDLTGKWFKPSDVSERAYKICYDETVPTSTRVTAMQIASKHSHPKILNLARDVLKSRKAAGHLKVSAIAAIGEHGDDKDAAYLKTLLISSDTRLRTASKCAIKKLGYY